MSFFYNQWKQTNFSYHPENVYYGRYRYARKIFRKAVKTAQNSHLSNHYIKLDKLKHAKPYQFWKTFRTLKKSNSKRIFKINNKTEAEDITNEFAHHFNYLLNTPRINPTQSEQTYTSTANLQSHSASFSLSPEEIKKAINLLKRNKSNDPTDIFAEHFIYSNCEVLYKWLADLFNHMFKFGIVPKELSISTVIPLVKSYKKSLSDPNNYRGISLIPILTKLLETLIILKCPQITYHSANQFGFKAKSSTVHAAYTVKETIKYYNKRNSPVFICSLDAEKAFDSCNWNILFSKLTEKEKLPLPVVSVLQQLYTTSSASVVYDKITSYTFNISQGVRQGSILSPHLYNMYMEDLLEDVKKLNIGTTLNNVYTGIIAYADDIILMSPTISGLQTMLDECISYGKKHWIKFNPAKTEFVVSGHSHL